MEEPSQSAPSQLCRNGCGFYGSPQTEGMCSKCYKEVNSKKNSGRKSPAHSKISVKPDVQTSSSKSLQDIKLENEVSDSLELPAVSASHPSIFRLETRTSSPIDATIVATTSVSLLTSTDSPSSTTSNSFVTASSCSASVSPSSDTQDSPFKLKKSRCATCRKRVGLTGFNCRCGKLFCGSHRYSDQHNCEYDYRADGQAKIRKENPLVVGEKIQKI